MTWATRPQLLWAARLPVLLFPDRREARGGFVIRCGRRSTPSDWRARLLVELVMGLDAGVERAGQYREHRRLTDGMAGPDSPRHRSSGERVKADALPRERAERTLDRTRGPRLFFNEAGVLWGDIRTIGLDGESGRLWQDGTETGLLAEKTSPRVAYAQLIRMRGQLL